MRVIYADSMMLLNFTIDCLLLLAAGKILALPMKRWRMALAAAFGGVYALFSALWPGLFALAVPKLLSGLGIAAIAFGGLGPFPRSALVFFAVSAAFGGAVYAAMSLGGIPPGEGPFLKLSPRTLILSFALCYCALSLVFRGLGLRAKREMRRVEIHLHGRSVSFMALRDTGNELRDSKGSPIMAAEWGALSPLFPELPRGQSCDGPSLVLSLSALPGMESRCRLFPCLTATSPSGLLPAIRPDEIIIEGQKAPHSHIAIVPGPLSSDGSYRALF